MFDEKTIIDSCDGKSARIAADQLGRGKVIALPTDTVYGLACDANDPAAIQMLYEIKGRDEGKPVAICVSSIEQLRQYGEAKHLSTELLAKLLPGPITIVLSRTNRLRNAYLNPGTTKIGLRIPDYQFIQKVSAEFVSPIALTSANRSGGGSTLEISEFKDLWPRLGAVFDGGHLGDQDNENQQRQASTVIDLSGPGAFEVIRPGIAIGYTVNVLELFDITEKR